MSVSVCMYASVSVGMYVGECVCRYVCLCVSSSANLWVGWMAVQHSTLWPSIERLWEALRCCGDDGVHGDDDVSDDGNHDDDDDDDDGDRGDGYDDEGNRGAVVWPVLGYHAIRTTVRTVGSPQTHT